MGHTQWLRPYLYALEPRFTEWGFARIGGNRRILALTVHQPGYDPQAPREIYGALALTHAGSRFRLHLSLNQGTRQWDLLPSGCVFYLGGIYEASSGRYESDPGVPTIRKVSTVYWDPSKLGQSLEDALAHASRTAVPFLTGKHQPGTYAMCRTCPNESLCLMNAQVTVVDVYRPPTR